MASYTNVRIATTGALSGLLLAFGPTLAAGASTAFHAPCNAEAFGDAVLCESVVYELGSDPVVIAPSGAASSAEPSMPTSVAPPSPPTSAPTAPKPVAPVPTTPPSTVPATRPLQHGAVAFGGQIDSYTDLSSYRYVQLNAWEHEKARELQAAYPDLQVMVYKDMSSVRSYAVQDGVDDTWLPTGVGHEHARRNPDWFLTDSTGARMLWPFSGHWWMDVGHPGYQQAWLANVSAEIAAGPWDGVIIDNVMASPEWYLGDRTIGKYPTRDDYAAATESFLTAVGPALRAQTGKTVMGNISDAWPTTWDRWVGLLSGANHEHSFSWNNGQLYGGSSWLGRIEEMERTQRAGKIFTATSEAASTETDKLTYLRASFLLAWDGGASGSAQMVHLKDRKDPWNSVIATDLGLPTGPRTSAGQAWLRPYSNGMTVVNPTSSTVTVPLGRTLQLDGRSITSVTLLPLSGALLTS